MLKSAPLQIVYMLTEIIPDNNPNSQTLSHVTSSAKVVTPPMQAAWLSLIKKYEPYDWFATLTFRDPIHPEIADRRFRRLVHQINQDLYGGNYRKKKKSITWFKAMERQKRGVLHFHCLIGSPDMYRLRRDKYMKAWLTNCGMKPSRFRADPGRFDKIQAQPNALDFIINGIARIYKYDPSKGADHYCSKYVTKGFDNIDVFVNPIQAKFINDNSQTWLL